MQSSPNRILRPLERTICGIPRRSAGNINGWSYENPLWSNRSESRWIHARGFRTCVNVRKCTRHWPVSAKRGRQARHRYSSLFASPAGIWHSCPPRIIHWRYSRDKDRAYSPESASPRMEDNASAGSAILSRTLETMIHLDDQKCTR